MINNTDVLDTLKRVYDATNPLRLPADFAALQAEVTKLKARVRLLEGFVRIGPLPAYDSLTKAVREVEETRDYDRS